MVAHDFEENLDKISFVREPTGFGGRCELLTTAAHDSEENWTAVLSPAGRGATKILTQHAGDQIESRVLCWIPM